MTMRSVASAAFFGILILGCLIGLLFFFRPTASAVEKRDLTEFPPFTIESFLDGSYFSDVSLWYSDTYPLREPLVSADQGLKQLYGIQPKTQMIGGNTQSQEIPQVSEAPVITQETKPRQPVEPPDEGAVQAEVQDKIMSGLYVDDGAAYSMYYFDQESVDTYVDAINTAAEKLKGTSKVFSVLIPTNAAAILPQETVKALGGADQAQALAYFYGSCSDDVITVETLDTLREHNDEYIYFRTDHHWTALGAYYIYENLCAAMGIEPKPLDSREMVEFGPFLGSFYSELNNAAMAANPDTVYAWIPAGTNETSYTDHDGVQMEGNVITDVSGWNENSLYMCFISGDQPYMEIKNPSIDDGSSCLLVKDSYGCCFAPFLVDNFETLYIMDYRYSDKNIVEFARENSVDDVVFLNNISIAGTYGVATTMQSLVS